MTLRFWLKERHKSNTILIIKNTISTNSSKLSKSNIIENIIIYLATLVTINLPFFFKFPLKYIPFLTFDSSEDFFNPILIVAYTTVLFFIYILIRRTIGNIDRLSVTEIINKYIISIIGGFTVLVIVLGPNFIQYQVELFQHKSLAKTVKVLLTVVEMNKDLATIKVDMTESNSNIPHTFQIFYYDPADEGKFFDVSVNEMINVSHSKNNNIIQYKTYIVLYDYYFCNPESKFYLRYASMGNHTEVRYLSIYDDSEFNSKMIQAVEQYKSQYGPFSVCRNSY